MQVRDLISILSKKDEDMDVYIRYGNDGQVSDIGVEFVCDDNELGDFYLLCSNGQNIQNTGMDGD